MVRTSSFAVLGLFAAAACSGHDSSGGAPISDAGSEAHVEPKAEAAAPRHDASKPPVHDASHQPPVAEAGAESGAQGGISPYPKLLSQTGLYTDLKTETLGEGVRAFQPRYTLWSDAATKRRWLYLPDGEKIDTSDMDYWKYPVGTKVWKEFSLDGKRIETRLLHKAGPKPEEWVMIAYQWNDALTEAEAVPGGVMNAKGTTHDIPEQNDCLLCHGNMKDRLLGVTAIQLSHSLGGVTIPELISEGRLSNPPAAPFAIPGGAVAEQALGYLHANCGNCHNPMSFVFTTVALNLWESTKLLGSVETTTGYTTTVLQPNSFLPNLHIIEPGRPDASELIYRVNRRGTGQMPPLATEFVDTGAVAKVRAWIEAMPPVPDSGVPPVDAGTKG
jgi:hypothetical protein